MGLILFGVEKQLPLMVQALNESENTGIQVACVAKGFSFFPINNHSVCLAEVMVNQGRYCYSPWANISCSFPRVLLSQVVQWAA